MIDLFEIQVGARFGWRTGLLEWSAKRPEGASWRCRFLQCLRCNALIVGVVSMQLSLWLTLVSLGGEGKYNQTSLLSFLMSYSQTSQQVLLLRDITFEILWHRALEFSQALLQLVLSASGCSFYPSCSSWTGTWCSFSAVLSSWVNLQKKKTLAEVVPLPIPGMATRKVLGRTLRSITHVTSVHGVATRMLLVLSLQLWTSSRGHRSLNWKSVWRSGTKNTFVKVWEECHSIQKWRTLCSEIQQGIWKLQRVQELGIDLDSTAGKAQHNCKVERVASKEFCGRDMRNKNSIDF